MEFRLSARNYSWNAGLDEGALTQIPLTRSRLKSIIIIKTKDHYSKEDNFRINPPFVLQHCFCPFALCLFFSISLQRIISLVRAERNLLTNQMGANAKQTIENKRFSLISYSFVFRLILCHQCVHSVCLKQIVSTLNLSFVLNHSNREKSIQIYTLNIVRIHCLFPVYFYCIPANVLYVSMATQRASAIEFNYIEHAEVYKVW